MGIEVAERQTELSAREVRIVGCLIEKELSTPDYYPMTINALTSACNQKTNREPVVEYSESDVADALERLQRKRLVGTASSSYGRATKYRHALAEMLGLEPPQLAVLATLLLRGAETAGEIRGRTGRMHAFDTLEDVDAIVDGLSAGDAPLVAELPMRPGQKEARFAHMLGDEPVAEPPPPRAASDSRLDELEEEVVRLKDEVSELSRAFRQFKKQFE